MHIQVPLRARVPHGPSDIFTSPYVV